MGYYSKVVQQPALLSRRRNYVQKIFVFGLLVWTIFHTLRKKAEAVGPNAAHDSRGEPLKTFYQIQKCNTAAVIEAKANGTQMTNSQFFFIVDSLHTAQYINGADTKLLVFGLGNDSPTWSDLNCNRRSVFIEDNNDWFDMITTKYPDIEAYLYKYNTTLVDANKFYDEPFMMEIDPVVDSECFDLTLIDAPMGFSSSKPGRMVPAYYAQKRVKDCMSKKKKDIMFVFMHDMERPGEQEIAKRYFSSEGWISLGAFIDPGEKAKLNGWAYVG